MSYRRFTVNVTRSVQSWININSAIKIMPRSCVCTTIFTKNRSPSCTKNKSYHNNDNYNFREQNGTKSYLICGGLLITLLEMVGLKEKEEYPELILLLKRSILLIQKEEYEKAEQMLHIALREAQKLQHYDGITYVYDIMANLAFDTGNYKKAEKLFVSVLQRLVSNNVEQDDLRVIHISLKMAKAFAEMGYVEKSESGFKFCIEKLKPQLDAGNSDEDVIMLLGMSYDWYAHMLFAQSRYKEAFKYFLEAYQICEAVNGEEDEQTTVLLNDLGTVSYMMGQYDQAIKYLSMVIERGKKIPNMIDTGPAHINLGNVFIKKGLYDEARKYCQGGLKLVKKQNNVESITEAEKCLNEIKKLTA